MPEDKFDGESDSLAERFFKARLVLRAGQSEVLRRPYPSQPDPMTPVSMSHGRHSKHSLFFCSQTERVLFTEMFIFPFGACFLVHIRGPQLLGPAFKPMD
jgi:hypothetical protein